MKKMKASKAECCRYGFDQWTAPGTCFLDDKAEAGSIEVEGSFIVGLPKAEAKNKNSIF
jgi:hypothetical protein